ncbi:CDP-alcohol phosphatidyltransferase family protein [Sphingomonas crusticola]|uniref:CDP-alcohol phosphatidyltransferase family protein n=1 Tax=Sphingomonas crusticola TaxID=1697973 RepID=UPI000E21D59B|nr:CDP-alcohol phosphatidyltransferase family protein [Sphingomonas crusticola]
MTAPTPHIRIIGDNRVRLWGLTPHQRITRIAGKAGLALAAPEGDGPSLLINSDFAFDPQWIGFMLGHPETVLTVDGVPAMALTADAKAADAMAGGKLPALTVIRSEDHADFYNQALRKREKPFLERLTPAAVPGIERQSYYGAYKGVTDILTKYLWPEIALVLTRLCARIGISPNMVTTVGALGCVLAAVAFWFGHYWLGMAVGFVFMVLDTVDGKLARCTITSSYWGNIFDHGIDLVHPLFWWWAWGEGLSAWGLALSHDDFVFVMGVMVAGYVIQRVIEGIFIRRFKMHIHIWERFDSQFRLITARRNPNMVILFVSLLFGRPDVGLNAVAWWTVISCAIHFVRLAQAEWAYRHGRPITSWLDEPA